MAEATRRAGECPDLEAIAAYLDDRLSAAERARVANHLTACEDCYFVFSEAAQVRSVAGSKSAASDQSWRAWLATPKVAWSTAGAALATAASVWLIVAYGGLMGGRHSQPPELQALVAAVGAERTIESRLTGGFQYGPLPGTVRAGAVMMAGLAVIPGERSEPGIRCSMNCNQMLANE